LTKHARFTAADEYPLQSEDAGLFRTETYNQWAYDPVANIGLNIWFASGEGGGGQPFPHFMSTVIVFIDDEIWHANSQGEGNHANGIAAGNAFLTLEEPFRRWRIDAMGLLRQSRASEGAPPEHSLPVLYHLEVTVDIASPPIEQGSQGDRGKAASSGTRPRTAIRYEQLCRISGRLQLGERALDVNAYGMRSHRRNSASIYDSGAVGHTWGTALFPGGTGFHLLSYQQEPSADVGFLHGHFFDGRQYQEARVTRFPYYSGVDDSEQSRLAMVVDGKTLEVEVESLPPLTGLIPPHGVRLTRSPARFVMNGEEGGGVLERSLMPQFPAGGQYRAD